MGYPTFLVSILGIGMVTAVIGDMASHVGCTIGLKDTITAIGFVALGTSVPGKVRCANADVSLHSCHGSGLIFPKPKLSIRSLHTFYHSDIGTCYSCFCRRTLNHDGVDGIMWYMT